MKDTDSIVYYNDGANCPLPIPTKTGYTFSGWFKDISLQNDEIKSIYNIQEDTVLFAKWKINEYSIIYDLDGGELDSLVKEYTIETPTFKIGIPSKIGYTFLGWSTPNNNNFEEEVTIQQRTAQNLTFVANWELNKYNITYELGNGQLDNLVKEYTIETPTFKIGIPSKIGYTFLGWSTKEISTPNFETFVENGISGDLHFIANWKLDIFKINYNLNGGKLDNLITNYTIETPTFILKEPHREGYTFLGWYILGNNDIKKEMIVENGTFGELNYIAIWKINVYTINYAFNGGILDKPVTTYTVETPTFKIGIPSKIGYTFLGWSTPNNNNFEEEVTIQQGTAQNLTLVANWELNKYNINYDLNNGILDNLVKEYTIETLTFKIGIPSKIGYTFLGWSTPNNNNFEEEITIHQGSSQNLTFVANWKLNVYSITYDLVNGKLDNLVEEYTVETSTIEIGIPTRTGYDFLGWSTKEDSSPKTKIFIEKGTIGNLYFIGNWKPTTYNITYDLVGGTLNNKVNTYTIETSTFSLGIPIRIGYNFLGWTTSTSSTPNTNMFINKGSIGNISCKANWKPITYNITYDLVGGTLNNKINTYIIETPTFSLGIPTRVGYDFLGWSTKEDSSPKTKIFIEKGTIGNLYFIGNWKPTTYNITYDLVGGTLNNKVNTYTIETSTFSLGIPTRIGYNFLGWTTSTSSTPNTNMFINKGSIGNISCKANWKVNTYTVTYLNNDNSYFSSRQVDYNSNIPNIEYPVDQVHIFNNWKYNGSSIENIKMPSNNITVIADMREAQCWIVTGQTTDR